MNPSQDVATFMRVCGQKLEPYPRVPDKSIVKLRRQLNESEMQELSTGHTNSNLVEILDGIVDLIYVLSGQAHAYGLPLEDAWHMVQQANMAKLWTEAESLEREPSWFKHPVFVHHSGEYITNPEIISSLTESEPSVGEVKYVVKDETGKVRKPPSWVEPNIRDLIMNAWQRSPYSRQFIPGFYAPDTNPPRPILLIPTEFHSARLEQVLGFMTKDGNYDSPALYAYLEDYQARQAASQAEASKPELPAWVEGTSPIRSEAERG